ncbi:HK97 family phage prohead protease [Rhodococcus sp. P1Y]|uniref:HK97 family phage prohead protease n=1 Tax=Rhodococcus sp. P1Y TaxID=1302308 RepID=UPI000EB4E082|nr:HK97 family phage prohead protease [Rhodococcus sp. P1Y]AYJ48995.1 hypothetical protein D8W71_12340 [Rhodococcus sp. P1Y]
MATKPALTRSFDVPFEVRSTEDDGDGLTIEGYATVFDTDTEIHSYEGHFIERIAKSAYPKNAKFPQMQFNHGRDVRVGAVPIGAYTEVRPDDHGLFVRGRLFDNDLVLPVRQAIAGGGITGMSITMNVLRDTWQNSRGKYLTLQEVETALYHPNGDPIRRTITSLSVSECGPVVRPAYATTSVGVRSNAPRTLSISAARRQLQLIDLGR